MLPPKPDRGSQLYLIGVSVVTFLSIVVRVAFWFWVDWTIEDALIIGRMVRNMADYGELTFNVGQRVSAATSPLFALLAGMLALLGIDPIVAAKLLGLIASVVTCLLIFDLLCQFTSPVIGLIGSVFYILLPPVVAYSVGGMETAVYTFACCIALERLLRGHESGAIIWSSVAVLLRPDGIIMLAVVVFAIMWQSRQDLPHITKVIWPIFVILPAGFGLHWHYYNSIVPQSLIAKGLGYRVEPLANTSRYLTKMLFSQPFGIFVYFIAFWGIWRYIRRWPMLSLLVIWYIAYHLFFFLRAPLFDWYLQPPLFVLCLFAGIGFIDILQLFFSKIIHTRYTQIGHWIGGLSLGALLLGALLHYTEGRREAQSYEDQVRAGAGRWLAIHTSPSSLVFTESLGYIGYQTVNPFVDWPGLVSPNVPDLLISTQTTNSRRAAYDVIIAHYQPQYLVLRSTEWDRLAPNLKQKYYDCKEFAPTHGDGEKYIIVGLECQ